MIVAQELVAQEPVEQRGCEQAHPPMRNGLALPPIQEKICFICSPRGRKAVLIVLKVCRLPSARGRMFTKMSNPARMTAAAPRAAAIFAAGRSQKGGRKAGILSSTESAKFAGSANPGLADSPAYRCRKLSRRFWQLAQVPRCRGRIGPEWSMRASSISWSCSSLKCWLFIVPPQRQAKAVRAIFAGPGTGGS